MPAGQVIGIEPNRICGPLPIIGRKQLASAMFLLLRDCWRRCRSTTQPSISSGVSACCSIFADPQSAINDIARVLRPGGRAVLLDSDYGTRIVSDLDPDLAAAFSRASLGPIANPYAARHIPAQVHAAGLELEPDVGSSAFVFSSEMLLRTQVLSRDADDAVESGGLTRDVADAAVRAVHDAAERGLAFAAITVFGFVARKL